MFSYKPSPLVSVLIIIGVILGLAVCLRYFTVAYGKEQAASVQVEQTVPLIQANQVRRSQLKPLLVECQGLQDEDQRLANDNAILNSRLQQWGHEYDWSTNQAVPFGSGTSSAQ